MSKIVGITGIKISHPDLGDRVFKDVKHFEFNETGTIESQAVDKPILTTWTVSGNIILSKKQQRKLKIFFDRRTKPRFPRKLKKHIKADIHRFFLYKKAYGIHELLTWFRYTNQKIKTTPSVFKSMK